MIVQKVTLIDGNGRERTVDFQKTPVAYRAAKVLGYVARMIEPKKSKPVKKPAAKGKKK